MTPQYIQWFFAQRRNQVLNDGDVTRGNIILFNLLYYDFSIKF